VGVRKIRKDKIDILRNKTIKKATDIFGISFWKISLIVKKVGGELSKRIDEITPVEEIKKTLGKLKKKDRILGILSSNQEDNLKKIINKRGMDFFDFFYCGRNIFCKRRLIKKNDQKKKA